MYSNKTKIIGARAVQSTYLINVRRSRQALFISVSPFSLLLSPAPFSLSPRPLSLSLSVSLPLSFSFHKIFSCTSYLSSSPLHATSFICLLSISLHLSMSVLFCLSHPFYSPSPCSPPLAPLCFSCLSFSVLLTCRWNSSYLFLSHLVFLF